MPTRLLAYDIIVSFRTRAMMVKSMDIHTVVAQALSGRADLYAS